MHIENHYYYSHTTSTCGVIQAGHSFMTGQLLFENDLAKAQLMIT